MKKTFVLLVILLYVICQKIYAQPIGKHWGHKQRATVAELKQHFKQPGKIYAPFTFWFWDNPLDNPQTRARMLTMARTMMQQNLNPGYAHGRMCMTGLPDLPLEQWLSDCWFDTFGPILDAADTTDYYFAYCDEYWWPTGRAAGRVLENNPDLWAVSLSWQTFDLAAGQTLQLPASFFTIAVQLSDSTDLEQLNVLRSQMQTLAERDTMEVVPHLPATIQSKTLRRIGSGKPFSWKAPAQGNWRVYVFNTYYHPGADGGRLNYLDDRIAAVFITHAHQPYVERFGTPLGSRIPGVFADHEGDYGYKLAWSETLNKVFQEKYKEEVKHKLPLLIDLDEEGLYAKVRWQWFDTVSDIYTGFFKTTNQWLAEQGMYCISNLWEENLMWQAGAVGDFFKIQRVFTMPGTDCLGLRILNVHDFKETQSVCEFEGRRMQSEIMGAAGWASFTPVTIKQAANAAITWGINHVVPHGVFSTRKLAGNPWIPDWYTENPLWPYLHLWTTFVQRASYINSHGQVAADVLLLNPMDSVWELCGPGVFDPAFKGRVPGPAMEPMPTAADIKQTRKTLKEKSAWWTPPVMEQWFNQRVQHINSVYSQAMADLTARRIEYLIADRYYLRQMEMKENCLVRIPFTFKTVVLPPITLLPLDVAEKLVAFANNGGHVYYLGVLPEGSCDNGMHDSKMITLMKTLRGLPNVKWCPEGLLPEIDNNAPGLQSHLQFQSGAFPMLQQHRRIDGHDFFWLANNTEKEQPCDLLITNISGSASIWDCESGNVYAAVQQETDAGTRVQLTFDPYQAFWLVINPKRDDAYMKSVKKTEKKEVFKLDGLWKIVIDTTIQPEMEFPFIPPSEFTKSKGVMHALELWEAWGIQNFSGYVDYYKTFDMKKIDGKCILDLGTVWHMAQVWLNGREIGRRLWPPHRFNITEAVEKGKNQIQIRVGNLIGNSYGQPKASGLLGPVVILKQDE
jgi:hypothetical protein